MEISNLLKYLDRHYSYKKKYTKIAKEVTNNVYTISNQPYFYLKNYGFQIDTMDEIAKIKFNGVTVLDERTFINGDWTDLLYELRDNTSRLVRKMEQEEQHKKELNLRAQYLLAKVLDLLDIYDNKEVLFGNIKVAWRQDGHTDFYGFYYAGTMEYYVKEGNDVVLYGFPTDKEEGKYVVHKYIPGEWENTLISELNAARQNAYRNSDNVANNYISRLRNRK